MAEGTDSRFAAIHEDYLSCKICFEELDQPKSLPCLHTFCLKCIEQHAKGNRQPNNTFACPLCRNDCQIPEKGIQGFPTNFMVQGLKDVVRNPREQEERESTIVMCPYHPSLESNWFCLTCFQPICHECKEGYHKKKTCDCHNKSQIVNYLTAHQQTEISTLQNHLEMWNISSREMTSKVKHIQASKQKLKEEANLKYSEIEKKLNDEKKLIHNEIDQRFGKETELKECLENIEKFEEQMNATKKEISEIKRPEFTKNGLENYQKFNNDLRKSSQNLQETYSLVTKAMITPPSKTRLVVSEDVVCIIMERPLAKLQTDVDPSNIKCSLISEFSIKTNGEDSPAVIDLLCIHSKIYALMDEDTNIKMFHTHGMFLGVFKDKFSFDTPWSFCCLPNDTIAVSYKYADTIKVFDLEGNFRRKIHIGVSDAVLTALPDGTIAVGEIEDKYIDIYTQNFKRKIDERFKCGIEPLYIQGNKDILFISDRRLLLVIDLKHVTVYTLAETIAKFDPCGMCMDKWGNLLVTNRNYSKIYSFSIDQVSKRFQLEKVLLDQKNNKLHQPSAVCFSMDNELIVGQGNGKIKVFSYTEN